MIRRPGALPVVTVETQAGGSLLELMDSRPLFILEAAQVQGARLRNPFKIEQMCVELL